jgi:plastocyanin
MLAAVAVLLVACSSSAASPGDRVIYRPEPSHGPFVVVAVDNHFHDIHPVDGTKIAENRPFVVKNEGSNLHNFTVVGAGISIDIKPGHHFRWGRIGDHLKPGFYQVICIYHDYEGMRGSFFVTK